MKTVRLENFKTQTTLLLKEFKDKNYLTELEKVLQVKPVPIDKITLIFKSKKNDVLILLLVKSMLLKLRIRHNSFI